VLRNLSSSNVDNEINSKKVRRARDTLGRDELYLENISTVGQHEGKRSLGRSMRRYEDNIEVNPRGIGLEFFWFGIGFSGRLL
jgi:hypothetical protein